MAAANNNTSPVWEKILKSFREDLAADGLLQPILEIKSLGELLNDTKVVHPLGFQGRKAVDFMDRLQPTLTVVDEFLALIINCFDTEAALPGLVWGSINMILNRASLTRDTLYGVSDMIHELGMALPPLKFYKNMPSFDPIDLGIEDPLLKIHTELVCFYARVIQFFKRNKHLTLVQKAWSEISQDSHKTVKRVQKFSKDIMIIRDAKINNTRFEGFDQALDQIKNLDIIRQETTRQGSYVPRMEVPYFLGRDEILSRIEDTLSVDRYRSSSPQSFVLYGMGGVGKSQIALRYANSWQYKYGIVLWISADNSNTIAKSFRGAALSIGLIRPDSEIDDNSITLDVKRWLSTTKTHWLLVIDNADNPSVLQDIRPMCSKSGGSILMTSRDLCSTHLASDHSHVQPFDVKTGAEVLMKHVGLDPGSELDKQHASAINSIFDGLPLALGQMGALISLRRIPLKEFLPLYCRNYMAIDSKNTINAYYSLTLDNVWDMSLTKLPRNAQVLLRILAFLNPGHVQESLLKEGACQVESPILQFFKNELDFLEAEGSLLERSLIDKSVENEEAILRMHKLVQRTVIRRMSPKERQQVFSILVDILTAHMLKIYTVDLGNRTIAREGCERSLLHVERMLERNLEYNIFPPNNRKLAELASRHGWYVSRSAL